MLLKEKNMLLTLEQEAKRQRVQMPSPERLRKVCMSGHLLPDCRNCKLHMTNQLGTAIDRADCDAGLNCIIVAVISVKVEAHVKVSFAVFSLTGWAVDNQVRDGGDWERDCTASPANRTGERQTRRLEEECVWIRLLVRAETLHTLLHKYTHRNVVLLITLPPAVCTRLQVAWCTFPSMVSHYTYTISFSCSRFLKIKRINHILSVFGITQGWDKCYALQV